MDQEALPVFIGVAHHIEPNQYNVFLRADIYQLSTLQPQFIYPAPMSSFSWVFLITDKFTNFVGTEQWKINITNDENNEIAFLEAHGMEKVPYGNIPLCLSFLMHVKIDFLLNKLGLYTVNFIFRDKTTPIGEVFFPYEKAPTITPDQISAIASDPTSAKSIIMTLGCKFCSTKMEIYTALTRRPEHEKEKGWLWYADLKTDHFKCECKKTQFPLHYIQESMHGFLLKDMSKNFNGLSYVRQYSHAQISAIAEEFKLLLRNEKLEPPIQSFLESHEVTCLFPS